MLSTTAGDTGGFVCAAVIDISQQKRAEEDLKTLNETLEQRVAERTKAIQMLHDIATMANQAQNAEQAIEYCLRRVAMYNGWCFGHALLPAADNPDELVPAYAYYAEDPRAISPFPRGDVRASASPRPRPARTGLRQRQAGVDHGSAATT